MNHRIPGAVLAPEQVSYPPDRENSNDQRYRRNGAQHGFPFKHTAMCCVVRLSMTFELSAFKFIFLNQALKSATIGPCFARGPADVAIISVQEAYDVSALEFPH